MREFIRAGTALFIILSTSPVASRETVEQPDQHGEKKIAAEKKAAHASTREASQNRIDIPRLAKELERCLQLALMKVPKSTLKNKEDNEKSVNALPDGKRKALRTALGELETVFQKYRAFKHSSHTTKGQEAGWIALKKWVSTDKKLLEFCSGQDAVPGVEFLWEGTERLMNDIRKWIKVYSKSKEFTSRDEKKSDPKKPAAEETSKNGDKTPESSKSNPGPSKKLPSKEEQASEKSATGGD